MLLSKVPMAHFCLLIMVTLVAKGVFCIQYINTTITREDKGDIFGVVENENVCFDHGATPLVVYGNMFCRCKQSQTLFSDNASNKQLSCLDHQNVCTTKWIKHGESTPLTSIPLIHMGSSPQKLVLFKSSCGLVNNLELNGTEYWASQDDGFVKIKSDRKLFYHSVIGTTTTVKFYLLFDTSKLTSQLSGTVIKLSLLCTTNNNKECVLFKVNGTQTWRRISTDSATTTTTTTTATTPATTPTTPTTITAATTPIVTTTPTVTEPIVTTGPSSLGNTSLIVAIAIVSVTIVVLAVAFFIYRKKIQLFCCTGKTKKLTDDTSGENSIELQVNIPGRPTSTETQQDDLHNARKQENETYHTASNEKEFMNNAYINDSEDLSVEHYEKMINLENEGALQENHYESIGNLNKL